MARDISHLVVASRLETEFLTGCIKHRLVRPGSSHLPPVEEVWNVEGNIGKGTFGVVRIERRYTPTLEPSPSSSYELRAVKQISKSVAASQRWNYTKELEATAQFSLARYAPYFVRSYGWFENNDSIFIAMEYLSLGDLRRFMDARPWFSEDATKQIVRQLLDGIKFMHESNFAHRDLKPGNILVASHSPSWVVKIADFGISKQSIEGDTHLQTQIGTVGYMAPEVFSSNSYSVSVDIWAIGIIAVELLLKQHPFPTVSDLFLGAPLITDTETSSILTESCRNFIRELLDVNPATRPSARAALSHLWMEKVIPDSDDEESLFVTDEPLPRSSIRGDEYGVTPISVPSLAWSNLPLSNDASATRSTDTLLDTYNGAAPDARLLLPSLQCFSLEDSRYFVLRSDNPIDIETSVAHNVWTSSGRVNKILEKGWRKTDGQVILFFSVIKSQRFCGIAQMTSGMDWATTDEHWLEDNWQGRFTLRWLCLTELPFAGVRHVPVSSKTPGFRAIACYDGTEISVPSAFELLQAYTAREREQASHLISPPATVSPMDLDTVLSPPAVTPMDLDTVTPSASWSSQLRSSDHPPDTMNVRPPATSPALDPIQRTQRRHAAWDGSSTIEFNTILRPQR
ncbi:kinase-like protein [Xylaria palmicola]|nr:kinase-like protein [Xylaria palmicola]